MTREDVKRLGLILEMLNAEIGCLSLDPVEDPGTGRQFWQMEIEGEWFEGETASECFWRAIRQYRLPGSRGG